MKKFISFSGIDRKKNLDVRAENEYAFKYVIGMLT